MKYVFQILFKVSNNEVEYEALLHGLRLAYLSASSDYLCDTPAQGLIGLIGYPYQQVATSFPEAGLQRTPRLSVLGPEKFEDG